MKTIERLERAGWLYDGYACENYLFVRGCETIAYNLDKDDIVAYSNGKVSKVPDEFDKELILEKL